MASYYQDEDQKKRLGLNAEGFVGSLGTNAVPVGTIQATYARPNVSLRNAPNPVAAQAPMGAAPRPDYATSGAAPRPAAPVNGMDLNMGNVAPYIPRPTRMPALTTREIIDAGVPLTAKSKIAALQAQKNENVLRNWNDYEVNRQNQLKGANAMALQGVKNQAPIAAAQIRGATAETVQGMKGETAETVAGIQAESRKYVADEATRRMKADPRTANLDPLSPQGIAAQKNKLELLQAEYETKGQVDMAVAAFREKLLTGRQTTTTETAMNPKTNTLETSQKVTSTANPVATEGAPPVASAPTVPVDVNRNGVDDKDEQAMAWAKENATTNPIKAQGIKNMLKQKYPQIYGGA